MNWSHYQLDIFDFLKNSDNNLFVEALAGSGKSTVLEECNRRLPHLDDNCMPFRIINTAFNKHIQLDLQKKLKNEREVATLNSLGWQVYRNNVRGVTLDAYKNLNFLRKQFSKSSEDQKLFRKIQATVTRTVSLFKQLGLMSFPSNWVSICDTYGVETGDFKPEDDIDGWIKRVFDYSINELNIADFDDQIYQVIRQGWPIQKRNVAFVDEAQDLSPIQIQFDLQLGERLISVGDRHQAIYVFRGADLNAIDNLVEATSANILPLSVCYRCPKAVLRLAQDYVPQIEWAENAIEGDVIDIPVEQLWSTIRDGDYATCRTTAPLVAKCLQAIRLKRKAFVRGRDIGKNLFSVIDKIQEKYPSNNISEFINAASQYKIEQLERLHATGRDMEAVTFEDKIDTILALAEDADYVGDIERIIESIFSDESKDGIEFSTIHKAKGRERPRVFRIRPDVCPMKKVPPHLMKIEYNLKYIEITRAQEILYTVHEPQERKRKS